MEWVIKRYRPCSQGTKTRAPYFLRIYYILFATLDGSDEDMSAFIAGIGYPAWRVIRMNWIVTKYGPIKVVKLASLLASPEALHAVPDQGGLG